MEEQLQKELRKTIKRERKQKKLTKYMSGIGRYLLLVLPWIMVILTLLAIFAVVTLVDIIVSVIFYAVLFVYFINSVMLFYGASFTKSSLKKRLDFERKRGRPIDSLDGFDLLYSNVNRVINFLKVIAILCFIALGLFLSMLIARLLEIGYAAIGFALFGFGLALLVRSLNLNIHDVNGLSDFYRPATHQIFLDNFFAEIFANHLDPVTYLKWDEYIAGLNKILNPTFVQKIKQDEPDELPITFALERILFLYYLNYQEVLSREQFSNELKEVINIDSETFDIEKGLLVDGAWYFSIKDVEKLFKFIKFYNPGFFNIIDRLQLELSDNIERISKDPIYMDSSSQEVVFKDTELNIMVFLYNNFKDSKKYRLRIIAPGFEPGEVKIDIEVEGRGAFEIPSQPIPLIAKDKTDIASVLSAMLENGDTTWISLEPRALGEQTIQIFLETEDGVIIEGKTRAVRVTKDLFSQLKKLTSMGSILGGLATPLSRAFAGGGLPM
ncbi:MAG: hypothetical protein ACFFAO_05405 [Candidatus Hermodarchaeota archaeon]